MSGRNTRSYIGDQLDNSVSVRFIRTAARWRPRRQLPVRPALFLLRRIFVPSQEEQLCGDPRRRRFPLPLENVRNRKSTFSKLILFILSLEA